MRKILVFITAILIFAACGNKAEEEARIAEQKKDSTALHIALLPTFECLPLIVAEEEGMFDSCGINVALDMYYSQADCDTAMAERSAEAMITDIIRGKYWERENKENLYYATWTNTHYMLISSKKARVKELEQMTDRLMATTRYSISDQLADSAMERAGKTPEEMFKVPINNQEIRLNMLIENKMDAAFLQHPYAAEALAHGGTLLMHGGKSNAGVLAFHETADREMVKKMLAVYDEACDMINQKGVMHFAPAVEKYMHKDITKWTKHMKDIKFRHSSPVDDSFEREARQWLKEN